MRWKELYDKKHLKIAGLCLVSMLALGMALAGNASAEPGWVVCRESSGLTKYSTDQCTTAEGSGKWQWEGLESTDKVTGIGFTLTLTDTKTILGVTKVRCDSGGESKGTVGPGNVAVIETDEVKEAEKNCRGIEGGCESSKIEKINGVDLPWQEELFETESKTLTKIEADGGGEPGWAVTCKTALGSKTDTCKSESTEKLEEARLTNATSSGKLLVIAELEKKRKADCSEGGKESGEAEGSIGIGDNGGVGLKIAIPNFRVTTSRENKPPMEIGETALFMVENVGPNGAKPVRFFEARLPLLATWKIRNAAQEAKEKECKEKAYANKEECFYEVEYVKKEKGFDTLIVTDANGLVDSKTLAGK